MRRGPIILLVFSAACGGKSSTVPLSPTTPTSTAQTVETPAVSNGLHFTVSPIDISSIIYITPLGAMNPWGHTLPTDHAYFYHHAGNDPYPPAPVYAPAAGQISSISNGRIDVRVDSIYTYWLGPLALADGIAVGVRVDAGTLLGTHSTFPAFDFSVLRSTLNLNFINPLRYSPDTVHADGPIQYFDEPIGSAIRAKVLRTGGQLDGRIDYDVAGTLSGNWYAEDLAVSESGRGGEMYYGVRKLSFARDVFSPDRPRISIGGLGLTGLWATAPGAPEFTSVTPDSGLVVYRLLSVGEPQSPPIDLQSGWLLVQVLDAQRLRIEAVPTPFVAPMAAAGQVPTEFSSRAELYLR
jgi:hypothetical protein